MTPPAPLVAAAPNRKGRASKELILGVAADLFGAKGYRGTTMADIAAGAGLTHPGLLYHFPNKEDLLFAVMDRHLVPGVSRVARASEGGSEAVLRVMVDIARQDITDPDWVRLASGLMGEGLAADHPAHAYLRERSARIAEALAAGFEDVEPDPSRRLRIARILNSAWDGLRMNWLLDPTVDVVGDLEALVGLVRREMAESVLSPRRVVPSARWTS